MYELGELRDSLDGLAVQIGAGFGKRLDHSPKSVKQVETILGALHKDFMKTGNDEGFDGIALNFSAYIVKTIEENFESGEWLRDHPELGPESYPYLWRNTEIFPYAWCKRRLVEGRGENVWTKFQQLVLRQAG